MRRCAGLVPAAGAGLRLGRGPKAFVEVAGVPLIAHAVRALSAVCDEVVVAVPGDALAAARAHVPTAHVVAGAATRQGTVAALLAATDAPYVVVHDAARPLTPRDVLRRALDAAHADGAATAALPVADTLHDVGRDAAVPRDALRAIQTPQAFDADLLLRAHDAAADRGTDATDDAALVRALPHPVTLVRGSPWSHKITHADDLAFVDALARTATADAPPA